MRHGGLGPAVHAAWRLRTCCACGINTNKSSYSNSYSQNLTDEESERRDKKILNKKKFGPYKVCVCVCVCVCAVVLA